MLLTNEELIARTPAVSAQQLEFIGQFNSALHALIHEAYDRNPTLRLLAAIHPLIRALDKANTGDAHAVIRVHNIADKGVREYLAQFSPKLADLVHEAEDRNESLILRAAVPYIVEALEVAEKAGHPSRLHKGKLLREQAISCLQDAAEFDAKKLFAVQVTGSAVDGVAETFYTWQETVPTQDEIEALTKATAEQVQTGQAVITVKRVPLKALFA